MSRLSVTLYSFTPIGAMTLSCVKSLERDGDREQLQGIIDDWEGKSKLGKFLSYINPFAPVDKEILARESRRILTNLDNPY